MDPFIQLISQIPFLTEILTTIVALHSVALVIVNLTPTPKDNAVLNIVYPYIEALAGLVTNRSKQHGFADVRSLTREVNRSASKTTSAVQDLESAKKD